MQVVLFFLVFVACSSSKKISSDDDEEGGPVIPETSFSCEGKIDGFYADVETGCVVYHYCQTFLYPDDDSETKDWPFQCPPTTIFRQQLLTCSKPHKSFKCEDSEKFYDVNDKPAGTAAPPASKPVLPEETPPTTTPSPTTLMETEPPITTETPEEPTTKIPEKTSPKPPKPDEGFLLPPLKPGEIEDQYFLLPHAFPYLLYPSLLPPWFHLDVKNTHLKPFSAFNCEDFKKIPPVQTLDDYLKKTSWDTIEKHLKKGILPAGTKLLQDKLPEFTVPKFSKKLFETSYTIKNGKLTDEPFQFKFFTKGAIPTGPM